jgi:septation ring formation regulator EzrA
MADDTPVPETLESIAGKLTALGKAIDERFAKVDQQFAKVDQQFAKVDQQFAKVDQQFAKVDQQFAKVDQQFANVDQQFADVKRDLGARITAVDGKVWLLGEIVDKGFAETRAQLGAKIEAVDAKVKMAYEAIVALNDNKTNNDTDHARFVKSLAEHDVRLLALEPPKPITKQE